MLATAIAVLLSFSGQSSAALNKPKQLVALKPSKISGFKLREVTVQLVDERYERVIDTLNVAIGDCGDCARGIAVKGVLGIRFEGRDPGALRIVKRSTRGVHYRDCKHLEFNKSRITCTFSFGESTYSVSIVPKGNH